ncbi:TetR/AcrR family transcriptional regulator [Microbacterium istanbulense]|uniref:TetR family transcriptional regulator n=1 Tax=Microbacterium istanbulense TaxID=3122049 RepID=A0ABU8LJK1_9MICO
MPHATPRRRRDPEARRREIVTAAAELIIEVGVDALTHRMIAARAGVPLGATTQYFATLDDLRAEALTCLAAVVDTRIDDMRAALAERGATAAVLTDLVMQGLNDAHALEADRAVVTAAVHDPTVRTLARRWVDQMTEFLAETHGVQRATAVTVFMDGILWHSQMHAQPLPAHLIQTALADLLGEESRTSSPSD